MSEIKYKLAEVEDFDSFYKIKCDSENIRWSGFNAAPDRRRLFDWYLNNYRSVKRTIYLVIYDTEIVGFFYLDKLNENIFEAASSGILQEYCNLGLGTKTIIWREELAKANGAQIIETWVSEFNHSSYRRLIKRGWQRTSDFEFRDVPLAGGQQKFYKWKKNLK